MITATSNSQFCKLVDVRWMPHENGRKECCSVLATGQEDFSGPMCSAICTLCCKKVILTFEPCHSDSEEPTPADDIRDYPTTTVTDHGLSFTTSAYGVPLPIVFGADKLTGNVFWASTVKTVPIAGGTEYYQTVDFALGLCEGEINGILRMWLGEKLILDRTVNVDGNDVAQPSASGFIAGASIDLTDTDGPLRNTLSTTARQTKIDVYIGSEYQLPDPTMVLAEGYENAPGYRGTAYILFRNFIIAASAVPNIFAELTSNTTSTFPRLFGQFNSPEVHFDRPTGDAIIVDPSYNMVYVPSRDINGDATPVSGRGIAAWNFNTLALESETEINVTEGFTPTYNRMRLLPTSGNLLIHEVVSNAGSIHVFNPHAGIFLGKLGPGGGVSNHNILTGLSALGRGSIAFPGIGVDTFGQIDIFMGVGQVNKAIGFVEIDENGRPQFLRNLGAVMTESDARSAYLEIDSTIAEASPTFIDGVETQGGWVFMLVYQTDGDRTQFHVARMRVTDAYGNSTLLTTVYEEFDTILMDDLRGAGLTHNVATILVDPRDRCLVVFCEVNGGTSSIVFKYSPFTGEILWKTTASGYVNHQGSDTAFLTNSTYCWITTSDGAVFKLDMTLGEVTTLAPLISIHDLPIPTSFTQFYNSLDNSITYLSGTAGQYVTKVFLEKLTRSTVELGDIVQTLLARVGLLGTDIDITDVDDLVLDGYTIKQKQSLRTCFSELAQAFKYDVVESNGRIKYLTRGQASAATIPKKHFGNVEDEGWLVTKDENDIARLRKISITYRDLDREYKDNVQSIILPNTSSRTFDNDSSIDVSVPIVLRPGTAKTLAEILLYAKLVYDTTYEGILPARYAYLDPGDVIIVQPDDTGINDLTLRLRRTTLGADRSIKFEASREDPDIYNDVVNLFGAAGRYIDSTFRSVPPRVDPVFLEMAFRSDIEGELENTASYVIFATYLNSRPGTVPGREIGIVVNGDKEYTIPRTTTFPTWGFVIDPPTRSSSVYTTDDVSILRVKMMSLTGADIASATHANLLASDQCNLAWVGGELIQFTDVVNEGDNIYAFTGLHRAKLGSESKFGVAVAGSRFVLLGDALAVLDESSIVPVNVDLSEPNLLVQIFMRSANPFQPKPLKKVMALNLTAFAVANLDAGYVSGDAVVTWNRATRYNGGYPNDGDETVPLNEIDETYVMFIYADDTVFDTQLSSTYLRKVELTTTGYTYTDAEQVADGFDRTTTDLYITIYQQGSATDHRYGVARKFFLPQL